MALVRLAATAVIALHMAAAASLAHAAEGVQLAEQKIKAGLIYNFLKYTTWPRLAGNAPMIVCLLGGDPFDGHLGPLGGRTVNQHTIEVRTLRSAAESKSCAVLILHQSESASWPRLRKTLDGQDILTIADFDGFAGAGGMIEFARANERIAVMVNIDAIGATGLKVEDRLLKLASVVRTAPEP
jgi:hypothetical protein